MPKRGQPRARRSPGSEAAGSDGPKMNKRVAIVLRDDEALALALQKEEYSVSDSQLCAFSSGDYCGPDASTTKRFVIDMQKDPQDMSESEGEAVHVGDSGCHTRKEETTKVQEAPIANESYGDFDRDGPLLITKCPELKPFLSLLLREPTAEDMRSLRWDQRNQEWTMLQSLQNILTRRMEVILEVEDTQEST